MTQLGLQPTAPPATPPQDRPETDLTLVSPEPLMKRSGSGRFGIGRLATSAPTSAAARALLLRLLDRMGRDRLTVTDSDGTIRRFGTDRVDLLSATAPLEASVTILDDRAWSAILLEGSVGLGRGFIEGWWHSEDPTTVVQILIRNMHGLDDLRNRLHHVTGRFTDTARRALPRTSRRRNREDIGAHYDLGNDFFKLFLDDTMTYSSAVFAEATDGLRQASLGKYDRLLTKLGVHADHSLLEIGTGWGGMALRAAEQRGADVTTTTVSEQQLAQATELMAASSARHKVKLLNRDWRDLTGRFDRVVSIEMIEAVDWRDYNRFFATIERCLAPDGMVGLQAITVPDQRFGRVKNTEDFIRRFVFPGGFLPSIGAIATALGRSTRLQLLDVEDLSAHYAETLRHWRHRFETRLADVHKLGLDDRFCRLWRFYLAYCEAGFLERHCSVNQIVLVGPEWRPTGLDVRPV